MKQQNIIIAVVILAVLAVGGFFLLTSNDQSTKAADIDTTTTTAKDTPKETIEEKKNIVDIALGNPDFSTLVTAVKATGLVETLSGQGPFTVFAPTNEAFAKLPKKTLDAILADKEQLTAILTYHVVSGKVMAKDVISLKSVQTVQGGDLEITVNGNTVMVNKAQVVKTDIEAANGVIHVIDTVLIPK